MCNLNKEQTILHLLTECNSKDIQSFKRITITTIEDLYSEYFILNSAETRFYEDKLMSELPWKTDIGMYLFPNMSIEFSYIRYKIIDEILDYYSFCKKWIKYYDAIQSR